MKRYLLFSQKAVLFVSLLLVFIATSCDRDKDGSVTDINVFSINDDIRLGAQVATEVDNNPAQYPQLDSTSNPQAYAYLYTMRDAILQSSDVAFRDRFAWRLRIIRNDSVLNAFCTPGGYIYVYTGLIKYLDSASQLAGVLGHEIAHADKRHSTDALTRQYGISLLLQVVLGNNAGALTQIAAGLLNLSYSRAAEKEADEFSVKYLCNTVYNADGAAGFFQKLINSGNNCASAFFSTHPCPDDRVQSIRSLRQTRNCQIRSESASDYQNFKNLLP
jgi:predicted Zn-dependent protease